MRKELNVLVDNGFLLSTDYKLFYGDPSQQEIGERTITIKDGEADMYDLLVMLEVFPSKAQARKNWKRSGQEIPYGYSDFEKIGKLSNRLTIFKPMEGMVLLPQYPFDFNLGRE